MIWEEVERIYGKTMAKKLAKSKYLKGITVTITVDGKRDIPESDIRLALKDVTGKPIHPLEVD